MKESAIVLRKLELQEHIQKKFKRDWIEFIGERDVDL